MKPIARKIRKQHGPAAVRVTKPRCGTLTYIAECRGPMKKTGNLQSQVASVNRIARKRPTL